MCAEQSTVPKMTAEEKLQNSRNYKEAGNELYKAKDYKAAIGKYHRALLFIKGVEQHNDKSKLPGLFGARSSVSFSAQECPSKNFSLSEEMENELRNLKADCYNNLAACLLQQENINYEKVINYCNEVLSIDPKNVKGLYRKGVAYYNLKNYEQCLKTLKEAKACSPLVDSNIQRYIDLSEKLLQQHKEREKERYKGMFEKLANVDVKTSA